VVFLVVGVESSCASSFSSSVSVSFARLIGFPGWKVAIESSSGRMEGISSIGTDGRWTETAGCVSASVTCVLSFLRVGSSVKLRSSSLARRLASSASFSESISRVSLFHQALACL